MYCGGRELLIGPLDEGKRLEITRRRRGFAKNQTQWYIIIIIFPSYRASLRYFIIVRDIKRVDKLMRLF